ncbi:MmgE/PrpD family protein [Paraburkholderia lacunae]|uniref:MmgE/PrpD family protein n=1 Tax=Paraburkholderia lacunae TaxID=2211104 RepID=A0A370N5V4_9BURK|nr:MmgE/PrpD family protein [Paraburkholderia lacunae]RDK00987.1 MmgE/PrpD family protein [Paraburkholderia lacunae]
MSRLCPSTPAEPAAGITRQLAAAIANAVPSNDPAAIAAARRGMLDFLAAAFAGARDPGYRKLLTVNGQDSRGEASVIGSAAGASAQQAALLNGYAGHALDYDDVHSSVRGHPATVLLPALFALAQTRGSSAFELLDAYVVGLETMARLGLALGSRHYEQGFHNTATLGTLGAAAAASFLLKLDAAAVENALGLAATQSAGLRLQFGSEAKPLHAGLAARAGVFAVELAAAGLQGSAGALDGPAGFFAVFSGGAAQPERVLEGWGAPWQIVTPGLYFKPWACCTATHYAVHAALTLRELHRLSPHDIERVTVTFPPGGDTPLANRLPATGLEARFSVEYAVAAALADGSPGVATFADVPVRDDLIALALRVTRRHDETAARASTDPATRFSTVEIELRDGTVLSHTTDRLYSAEDLHAKFADATSRSRQLEFVPSLIDTMHSAADLASLFKAFAQVSV